MPMNDVPRRNLRELIRRYGFSLCEDPQRLEALLRDHCPDDRREVAALVAAVRARVAGEIERSSDSGALNVRLGVLAMKLETDAALTPEAARWAVESWAVALGMVSEDVLESPIGLPPTRVESASNMPSPPPIQPDTVGRPARALTAGSKSRSRAGIAVVAALVAIAVLVIAGLYARGRHSPPQPGATALERDLGLAVEIYRAKLKNVEYPVVRGHPDPEIQEQINRRLDSSKEAFSGIEGFRVSAKRHNLLSIVNNVCLTGGAHPVNGMHTHNIDLTTGRSLELGDVFEGDYTNVLTQAARPGLVAHYGDGSYDGAIGSAHDFYIEGDSLVFPFFDGEVASMAAGSATVAIALSRLRAIVKPAGPLEPFLNEMPDARREDETLVHESDLPDAVTTTAGLIAYYPFAGNAADANGNGLNGLVSGATLTGDRFGVPNSAYHFDGASYIDIPGTGDTHLQSGFSLVAWTRFSVLNRDKAVICKHINYGANGFLLGIGDNNCFNQFDLYGCSDVRIYSTQLYDDGLWHFVVGTFDGSTKALYVDGALVASQPASCTTTSSANIRIGAASDVGYSGYNGDIDDVGIYNRSLTAGEVASLYAATAATSASIRTISVP